MANKVGHNKYVLEFDESPTAFRGFFFEVLFQGPDEMHGFEFTSEIQIIPDINPFPACSGQDCQGARGGQNFEKNADTARYARYSREYRALKIFG